MANLILSLAKSILFLLFLLFLSLFNSIYHVERIVANNLNYPGQI